MKPILLLLTSILLLAGAGFGQTSAPAPSDPLGNLELFRPESVTTEINLEGALLRLVAEATRQDDPQFSRMVSKLRSIRVRIATLEAGDLPAIRKRITEAAGRFDHGGWQPVVRVREADEETYIYLHEKEGKIAGLVVLFVDGPEEAGTIEITGEIDPAELGRLTHGLHLPEPGGLPHHSDTRPPAEGGHR